jgi:hypothetical protein
MKNTFVRDIEMKVKCPIYFLVVIILYISSTDIVNGNRNEINNLMESKVSVSQMVNWSETAKIIASDAAINDWFGISVAIYQNYSVIGARDDDFERGSAYVFKHDGNSWIQEQKLLASDGEVGDWFGISVAIYGDFVFVGADADDNENGLNAGSVYVFKHEGSTWILQDKLVASDGIANDYFGRYVSIDENYAIIGAYYDDDIAGSAYVFKRAGNEWTEEEKLTASDRAPGDYFGVSTSIEGDYAIIGAYREDNDNGIDAGSVYVFKRTSRGWLEETKLLASDGISGDRFGISTSIDDTYLVIGSYYDDGYTGSAYVFNKTSTGWVEENKLIALDGEINDFFGRSVSIYRDSILVGAWGDTSYSGSAYIFRHIDSNWIEETKLIASDASGNDRFGYQVSLYGIYALIGAYLDDNENGIDAGAAYIFELMNKEPSVPTVTGQSDGKVGVSYTYKFNSLDQDGDDVYYYIDWGDQTNDGWIGPYGSGKDIMVSHRWSKRGTYIIKAKAKDIYDIESEWATLEVTILKNKAIKSPFINFLESFLQRHPNLFPILQKIIQRLSPQ